MSQLSVSVVAAPHITLAGTDTRVTVVSADTPIAVLTMAEPPLTLVALSPDPVTVVGAGYGLQGTPGQGGSVPGAYPEPATAFNAGDPEFLFTDTGDVVMINVA